MWPRKSNKNFACAQLLSNAGNPCGLNIFENSLDCARFATVKSMKDIGELEAIRQLTRQLPHRSDVRIGAGDDCAVVRAGPNCVREILLKSDPVIEGTHFRHGTRPELIGHKAIGRVLSDIAAMGGEPRWVLFNIVAPPKTPFQLIRRLYSGAGRLARRHKVAIVGGDLSSGKCLEVHAFAAGIAPRGEAVLRSGARPGDIIYVTGSLGGSIRGRHLVFEPRVNEGLWLRKWASSMIDISDGLASDLTHILEAGRVGALLDARAIPVSAAARAMKDRKSPLDHALQDGEDFELLFTVPMSKAVQFEKAWKRKFKLACCGIGLITKGRPSIRIRLSCGCVETIGRKGYEHFHK
ncbi:MAG: thiamine-monophosphate kinase [Verrucomicrobia bacterium]|nr:thiamine-monophosphate kinase [Verrucomicrobiota bacterium]